MKCWCQLNRAPVAHDARPTLSSYQTSALSQDDHITAVTSVVVHESVTHLFTLRFHGLKSVEWTTTSANQ